MNIKDSYIYNGTAVLKDVKVENSVLKKILAGKDANDAYLGWETVCDLTGIKPKAAGTADKVGHKLTFSGGVTGTWDGSAEKTVVIPTKSSWNYDDVYLKLTGNGTTNPLTGTIYIKDVNGIILNSTDKDLNIWEVYGASGTWTSQFGFNLQYLGTSSGNNNDLILWAHNQTGTHVESYRVKQDGTFIFKAAPKVGTNVMYHAGNLTIKTLMGTTAIGDSDEPVYWNGSSFVKASAYPTKASWNYDDRYLKLSGGTLTGVLHLLGSKYEDSANTGALDLANSDIYGVNSIKFADLAESAGEGLQWYRDATHIDSLWVNNGVIYFSPNRTWGGTVTNYTVLHSGNLTPKTITLSTTAQTYITSASTSYTIKMPNTDPYTSARTPKAHTHYATTYKDSRNETMTPTQGVAVNGIAIDFKTKANGVGVGSGMYCGLITFDPYSDVSGGYPMQIGFNTGADSTNTNEVYIRTAKDANTWNAWRTIIHDLNYTSYTVKKDGTGASGTWDINISGDAATATKLATSRTIWGQSFNGTGNVSGALTEVTDITASGNVNCSNLILPLGGKIHNGGNYGLYISDSAGDYGSAIYLTHDHGKNQTAFRIHSHYDSNLGGLTIGFSTTTQNYGTSPINATYDDILHIRGNGNIGINTTSPLYKLHVAGDIYTTTGFKKKDSSDSYVLLGGGGHKLISAFSMAHDHPYLPLSGGTMSNTNVVTNLNADLLDGYHAGVTNGSVGIFVPWPNATTMKNEGLMPSEYGTSEFGHPDNVYLQSICKWAIAHYTSLGDVTLIGAIAPNSSGTCILHLYSSSGKDSSTLLPRYCSGTYTTLSGYIYNFGTVDYNWYYRKVSAGYASSADYATTSTYASNVGSSGTSGTNYVTASKVIAACNWYDTMIGSDSDTVINRWSEIVAFVAGFKETPDLATFLNNNYLAKAGGTMTGPLKWANATALPQQTSPQYFLCIDAFDDGGTTKWTSKADTLKALTGLTSTAIGDSDEPVYWNGAKFIKAGAYPTKSSWNYDDRYLKLSGGTLTGTLTINTYSDRSLILDEPSGEKYHIISFRANGEEYASLCSNYLNSENNLIFNGNIIYHSGNLPAYPKVNNGALYLQANGDTKVTFTANQSSNSTLNIATGSANGTISVGGTNVSVKGLGSNAYTSTAYLPLAGGIMDDNAQIKRKGRSGSWVGGRDRAIIRETSSSGYHPLFSLKTKDGSWELGEYNTSGLYNVPIFSYVTDTDYSNGNNTTTYQIKYPLASGTIALTADLKWSNISSKPETATRWPSWSEVTNKPSTFPVSEHNHDGRYLRWNGSAADVSAMAWGTLTAANGYTILSHAASSDGGDWGMVNKGGKIYMQLDGYYYQNEGQYRVTDVSETVTALGTNGNYLTWTKNGSISNITVPYASNAESATNANYFLGCTNTITVAGDANTYYPVMVSTTTNKKFSNIITVWKDLGSKTASYPENHSNGSSSMLYRYDIRNCYWDGNGGYCTTLDARYIYARLVSETRMLSNGVGNFCIWLRGGGTEYRISTSWNISSSDITVYYSLTNVGSSTYPVTIEPKTDIGNGGIYNTISIPCDVKYASYAGSVAWNNVTGKPATATRWPSWSEVTNKPTFTTWSETSSVASYSLSNAAWTNTITLPTTAGSYILNIVSGNSTLTGVFSIGASDNAKDEISLHLHGNGPRLYARTNGTTLQLSSNDTSATSRSVTIKYRRMI